MAVCMRLFFLDGDLFTFKWAAPAFCYTTVVSESLSEHTRPEKRTRLNRPLAMDFHRFFVPLWDLSLGNSRVADVENDRVAGPASKRERSMVERGETQRNTGTVSPSRLSGHVLCT